MFNHLIGQQEIILGDCREVLPTLSPVDVVATSPPYNIGVAYHSYDDRKPRDHYLHFMQDVASRLKQVLKPGGSVFLNMGSTNRDPWIMCDVANLFRSFFVLQNHIIWIKSISIGQDSVGHFKPIRSPRYLNQNHESIFHFTHAGDVPVDRLAVGVPFKDKSNLARRGHNQDRRCAGNVWYVPYETVKSKSQKFDHPAGYPIALARRCIRLHGGTNLRVLDPFLGAGTTLLAAEQLGHHGIGIEIDQQYVAAALARLSDHIALTKTAIVI